ncbi:hypothetical protein P7C70_g1406, partial [Phenoliferia sp. Uapishka_3]
MWGVLKRPGLDKVLEPGAAGSGPKSLESLDTASLQWLRIKLDSQIGQRFIYFVGSKGLHSPEKLTEVLDRVFSPNTINALPFHCEAGIPTLPALSQASSSSSRAESLMTDPSSPPGEFPWSTPTTPSLSATSPELFPTLSCLPYLQPHLLPYQAVSPDLVTSGPPASFITDWLTEGFDSAAAESWCAESSSRWDWAGGLIPESGDGLVSK